MLTSCYPGRTDTIRIVDSEGQPANLKRRVPVFNAQELEKQKAFKEQNGGITLIDESGPKTFNSRGNNYAYADEQEALPDRIFADKLTESDRKIVNKDEGKANIKESGAVAGVASKADDTVKSKDINAVGADGMVKKDDTTYLFPDDQTNKSVKSKSQKSSSTVNLNEYKESTAGKSTNKKSAALVSSQSSGNDSYYLQLGAFKSKTGAETMLNSYKKISVGEIKTVTINNQKIYRVVLGPYNTRGTAEVNKEKVIKTGHYDVFITKR
jgi:cell division protein FtsN